MNKPARTTLAATIAATMALLTAAPALAHVEVSAADAAQGGSAVLTFRVPTESDTASTTDLVITLPEDQPIVSVSTQPKPGWTATVVKKKLATPQKDDDGNEVTDYVSSVEFRADTPQGGIKPGQFDTFNILAGPLPKEKSVSFPAAQTYSDGHVVNWNEKAATGQAEPEHPAPALSLAAGGEESESATPAMNMPMPEPAKPAPAWPGITALVVSIAAALLGLANLSQLRRRR